MNDLVDTLAGEKGKRKTDDVMNEVRREDGLNGGLVVRRSSGGGSTWSGGWLLLQEFHRLRVGR